MLPFKKQFPLGKERGKKNMKKLKIADLETVKNELKKIWDNDSKMIEYCIKKYNYYIFEDKLIEFENFKNWSIKKIMYYDDETEAPEITLDNFIQYNKYNGTKNYNFDYWYLVKNNEKANIYTVYNSKFIDKIDDNYALLNVKDVELDCYNRISTFRKDNSNDELIQDFKDIIKTNNDNYTERLKKYFKRYNKNICVRGYWVNR